MKGFVLGKIFMLPPGHVAAGFMTAAAAVKIFHPHLSPEQINQLYWWGMFWGFAPDLDVFYAFFKIKAFKINPEHREYATHRPLVWLVAGLLLYFLSSSSFWRLNSVLMVAGSFSHFILDSIEYGIPWLWPFSSKLYALIRPGQKPAKIEADNFFSYWWSFVKTYITCPTFYCELIIIFVSALVYFNL